MRHLLGNQGRNAQLNVSMRDALKGRVEMIELSLPSVQTDSTNQGTRPGYLPLKDFIDELISLFQKMPAS